MPLETPNQLPREHRSADGDCATFDDIDIRRELSARPPHPRSDERERHAFAVLAAEMTANPRNMLQTAAELALDLCSADTSGISLLDGNAFRWEAVAGVMAAGRGRTVPRDESPFGVCIKEDRTQLLYLPDRHFSALRTEPRCVEMLLIPFHDRGRPMGTVWVVSHTHNRRFDREDERIVRVLADFAAAGWQLWKAYDRASDANHRKDEFLAMLGHELRNPLAAITTATSVLGQEFSRSGRARRALDVLVRQSRHLTRLADDLLDAGRIASGKLQLQTKRLNLVQVVAEALEMCRSRIDERSLGLTVDLPESPIWIEGDFVRLTQALCNLIDNASKYTPGQGRVTVSCQATAAEACVIVRDNGRGMKPNQLQVIFEPFAQLPESEPARQGGLGLGLSLVRSVVELHGGRVSAHSDGTGQGSRFSICLPRHHPATSVN